MIDGATVDRCRPRGGVKQSVEEELVSDLGDSAILRTESEEDEMTLADVLLRNYRGPFEEVTSEDLTAE